MFSFEEQGGEGKAVGWISMSDLFMLCSIVMLAVAVSFALSLKRTDIKLTAVEGEIVRTKVANSLTVDELKTAAARLTQESASYKAEAAALTRQVNAVTAQLTATESQRARHQTESDKFKSSSEKLAAELADQTAKLNTTQSEFEKYRNINTLTQGELQAEVLRLTKEANEYKGNVANLRSLVSTLEGKLAVSDKEGVRLSGELGQQKMKYEDDLAARNAELAKLTTELNRLTTAFGTASDDLAKTRAAVAAAKADRGQLLADINTWKAANAILQKDDDELKHKLTVADDKQKALEAKLAGLQGTIVGLNDEIGELKPQITKLNVDLVGAKLRIIDLEKAVFEKINRAKLVVTLTAQDVPKDFTLELFVTDPYGNEAGPFSSEIFNEGDEIGVLQQSVDFKSGNEGSQKAVFYSSRPVYSRSGFTGTYSVRAMIRHAGNSEHAQLAHPVSVNCSVDLPGSTAAEAHKVAKLDMAYPGYIKKVKRSGTLSPNTPYKNMWPWEPVNHFDQTICDFRIEGESTLVLRTFDQMVSQLPIATQAPPYPGRDLQEQKIDTVRNRSGN